MLRALQHALSPRKAVFLVTLFAVAGCTLNTDVTQPAALIKVSGDGQVEPTNTLLPTPLAVIVATQFGEPVQNATVNWAIVTGAGTLSATSTPTDVNGVASVTFTTGATAGTVVVRAQVGGVPPLTFIITVT